MNAARNRTIYTVGPGLRASAIIGHDPDAKYLDV